MNFKINLILDYFRSKGWSVKAEGDMFIYLKPSQSLFLPQDFLLEIPKNDNIKGFDSYINRLIGDFTSIYPEVNSDELNILFSRDNSIIKYRIFDEDNSDGSIGINKFIDSVESFKNVLYNAVNFTVNKTTIFGQTRSEANEYLKNCRVLQSEKGSYVTRFEIPNKPLHTTFDEVSTDNVNDKLFDVLEFVNEEIFVEANKPKFTENYIQDNQEFLNYELLKSIKNIYSKSSISNVEYTLCTKDYTRDIVTEKVQPKLLYFNNYINELRDLLFELTTFEAKGYIKTLHSNNPIFSNNNEVILDAKHFGIKLEIKFHLRSEEYLEAIDAHKKHLQIKVSGRAKELKTVIHITELETFEVLPPKK
jgi:hypothetical protein